jgi:ribosomal protein L32
MTRWVTRASVSDDDDESSEPGECSNCGHRGVCNTLCPHCEDAGFSHEAAGTRQVWMERRVLARTRASTWQQRVAAGVRRLVRVGKAGGELPDRGQCCLVLRGEEKRDLGQEAVVTKVAAARVHIAYRDADGRQATRVKHPASLVLLEEGLHVVQDARGCVWVKRDAM